MTAGNRNSWPTVLRSIFLVLALILMVSPVIAVSPAPSASPNPNLSQSGNIPVSSLLVKEGKPVIYFFYNTNCGECLETLPYVEEFAATHPSIVITLIDVRESDKNLALFKAFKDYYNTGAIPVPSIFVGNLTLSGKAEITGGLEDAANQTLSKSGDISVSSLLVRDGKPVIYFFYNTNCGECLETLPYVEEFAATHPNVVVTFIDIRENDENLALFKDFKEYYNTGAIPVPSIFVGNITLSGKAEITGGLEDAANQTTVVLPTPNPENGKPSKGELTIPLVIASALVDGINPCAFAVLIFLLVTIISLKSRRMMLVVGSVFILAVFIFYFLSGLGIFALIQTAGISRLISAVAAVIALAAGVISILSVFGNGTGQSILSIPESKKGIIDRYIRKASIPAAFAVGILVGMFELPCTGGIYLAILSLLSTRMSLMEGIPYLLLYNFFFILPLIVILGIVTYGLPVERLEQWRTGNRKAVRVLMGAFLIVLGLILLWELL